MIGDIFERVGVNLMGKVLNISSQRQRVIAGNIANVMTPGYTKKELNFEENLARAMGKQGLPGLLENKRHIPIGNPDNGRQPLITENLNEGTVDMEKEMAASAENQLLYSTVTKLLSGKFRSLQLVIRGR
jgi:flagellar basal-body rod protein FlgB